MRNILGVELVLAFSTKGQEFFNRSCRHQPLLVAVYDSLDTRKEPWQRANTPH